ncbi:MAG TPA: OmpH family outer membrane protein [Flavobacteriales bacterium]|jgi:outer membrane protein
MKKTLLLVAAVCLTSVASFAQKLGHINGQRLVENMPEYRVAYEQLTAYKQQYETALMNMQKEYEAMIADYQKAEKEGAPKVILETKIRDIQTKQQGIMDFQEQASQDVSNEEIKKVDPILKKAKAAIEAVAKDNGYTYIFDESTGTLLFSGGDDVTSLVCKHLGIPDYSKENAEPVRLEDKKP